MKKPLIGIVPLVDAERESYWMLPGYMDGVTESGGIPVMLPLTADRDNLQQLVETCDGFLFTGGQDISPAIYEEETLDVCGEICLDRDRMEIQLLWKAMQADKPILGICRGIQFINAALGGSLFQDLPTMFPASVEHHGKPPYELPTHNVFLADSPLRELLDLDILPVNSFHHQGIKLLAPGLEVMAMSSDGLIEGIYAPDQKFLWAVQWHPEFSFRVDENSRKIFQAFVEAAK
jgi:putative glutamine amidotransferase